MLDRDGSAGCAAAQRQSARTLASSEMGRAWLASPALHLLAHCGRRGGACVGGQAGGRAGGGAFGDDLVLVCRGGGEGDAGQGTWACEGHRGSARMRRPLAARPLQPPSRAPVSSSVLLPLPLLAGSGSGSMAAQQNLQRRALVGTSDAHSGHSPAGSGNEQATVQ